MTLIATDVASNDRTISRIEPEVALDSPPSAMNVVGGIAGRVLLVIKELDYEGRPLHAVGARLAGLGAAVIGEMNLVEAGVLEQLPVHVAHVFRLTLDVVPHELGERLLLSIRHLGGGQADRLADFRRRLALFRLGEGLCL